ncbi:MAG: hypothetical protein OXT67_04835 [Zetaproteobacteria bacterium]|nr:hypothetical protein [Zetaproteobacteria bacterium]
MVSKKITIAVLLWGLHLPCVYGNNYAKRVITTVVPQQQEQAVLKYVATSLLYLLHEIHPVKGCESVADYPELLHNFAFDLVNLSRVPQANPSHDMLGQMVVREVDSTEESLASLTLGQESLIPLLHGLFKEGVQRSGLLFTYEDLDLEIPYLEDLLRLYLTFMKEFNPAYMHGEHTLHALFEFEASSFVDLGEDYRLLQILTPPALSHMLSNFRKALQESHEAFYHRFTQQGATMLDMVYDHELSSRSRRRGEYVDMSAESIRPEYQHIFHFQCYDPSALPQKTYAATRYRMRSKLHRNQRDAHFAEEKNKALIVHNFLEDPSLLLFFARWLADHFPEESEHLDILEAAQRDEVLERLRHKPHFNNFIQSDAFKAYQEKVNQVKKQLAQFATQQAEAELQELLDQADSRSNKARKKAKKKAKKKCKAKPNAASSQAQPAPATLPAVVTLPERPAEHVEKPTAGDSSPQLFDWPALTAKFYSRTSCGVVTKRLARWNQPLRRDVVRQFVDYTVLEEPIQRYQGLDDDQVAQQWLEHQAIHFLPLFAQAKLSKQYFIENKSRSKRKRYIASAAMRTLKGEIIHGFVELARGDVLQKDRSQDWIHAKFVPQHQQRSSIGDDIVRDCLRQEHVQFSAVQQYFQVDLDAYGTITLNFGHHSDVGGGQLFLFSMD